MKTIPTKAAVESWLKNSWSQALEFIQKLRANKKVNEAVSQVQQRLGPELQKIRDDKRVQEAASKLKPHRRKLIAGGVGLFLIWAVLPSGSDAKHATIKYWAALNKIFKEEDITKGEEISNSSKSRPETIRYLNESHLMCQRVQSRLEKLPVVNVDDDLIGYVHQISEAFQRTDMAFMKLAAFGEQTEAEDNNLSSFANMAKHFFRGFSGDFTSSFREMDNLKGERKAQFQAIMNEVTSAMEAINKMRSDEIPLRSLLSKRYGVEFR